MSTLRGFAESRGYRRSDAVSDDWGELLGMKAAAK